MKNRNLNQLRGRNDVSHVGAHLGLATQINLTHSSLASSCAMEMFNISVLRGLVKGISNGRLEY